LGPCTTLSFDWLPKFLMKFQHFSIFLRDFSFFFEFFCTSSSNRALCTHHWDFQFMKI
jgi:hypothetical protein